MMRTKSYPSERLACVRLLCNCFSRISVTFCNKGFLDSSGRTFLLFLISPCASHCDADGTCPSAPLIHLWKLMIWSKWSTVSVYNWLQILLRSLLLFRESRLYTIIETAWKIPKPQHPNICLRRMCQRIQRQSECQLLSPNFPGQKL